MIKRVGFAFSLILLLLGSAWANEAPEEIKVTAEGYSYLGDDTSIKEARTKAMAEAERTALEQGVPIYLDSYTKVLNNQVDTDEIKSRMKGIIKQKKILLDELDKEELKYKVKIEAVVTYTEEQKKSIEKAVEPAKPVKTEKVQEIRMRGNERIREPEPVYQEEQLVYREEPAYRPEPIYRPKPRRHDDRSFSDDNSCQFPRHRIDRLWDEAQRLREDRSNQYIRLMTMLYPNVRRERIVPHFFTIRQHNPRKFGHIMDLLGGVPQMERSAMREEIHARLREMLETDPYGFIELLQIALPRFNPPEFRRRLERICDRHPRMMQEIEDLLRG